jgi:hypothetical protein
MSTYGEISTKVDWFSEHEPPLSRKSSRKLAIERQFSGFGVGMGSNWTLRDGVKGNSGSKVIE